MLAERKSEWIGVSLHTDGDRDACRSWFVGMDCGLEGPIKANILTRIEDDAELKLRALFRAKDGSLKELIRTRNSRGFSITVKPATRQTWV